MNTTDKQKNINTKIKNMKITIVVINYKISYSFFNWYKINFLKFDFILFILFIIIKKKSIIILVKKSNIIKLKRMKKLKL
jgi:hypothetical protein